jgi:hypothetical protein
MHNSDSVCFKTLYSVHFWLQNVHSDPTKCTVFILVFETWSLFTVCYNYDCFVYRATHYKIVFSFKIIYASPTCFGMSYAIIRGFVVQNQVLLCLASYIFGLFVSVLFSLLHSWFVYDDVFYVCCIILLYYLVVWWFLLCFIYMLTYFLVALVSLFTTVLGPSVVVPFFAAMLISSGCCVCDLFLRLLLLHYLDHCVYFDSVWFVFLDSCSLEQYIKCIEISLYTQWHPACFNQACGHLQGCKIWRMYT